MKTLDQYLYENSKKGIVDHIIRAHVDDNGWASFYIHPFGADGDTLDFDVDENQLFAAQIQQPDGTYVIKHAKVHK